MSDHPFPKDIALFIKEQADLFEVNTGSSPVSLLVSAEMGARLGVARNSRLLIDGIAVRVDEAFVGGIMALVGDAHFAPIEFVQTN